MESEGDGDGAGDRQRQERKERRSYHDTFHSTGTVLALSPTPILTLALTLTCVLLDTLIVNFKWIKIYIWVVSLLVVSCLFWWLCPSLCISISIKKVLY